jgi:hypothetical protein
MRVRVVDAASPAHVLRICVRHHIQVTHRLLAKLLRVLHTGAMNRADADKGYNKLSGQFQGKQGRRTHIQLHACARMGAAVGIKSNALLSQQQACVYYRWVPVRLPAAYLVLRGVQVHKDEAV